jgi:hypothetical protein
MRVGAISHVSAGFDPSTVKLAFVEPFAIRAGNSGLAISGRAG